MVFFKNPPVEGAVKSMEQKTRLVFQMMTKNSISGQLASTNAELHTPNYLSV